ncbi:MAG TPA: hypothetical protein DHV28_16180 [Ignavibacteriales bacterium]|nr:hypothetical protein [Ignavibacteriales bacterium]
MEDSLKQILVVHNSTINWSEILTALLVIVTAFYVYFTFRMMKASEKSVNATRESIEIMKKQIEASLRPYIDFELRRYPNHLIYMHIRNSGKINAVNLSLSLDKDFHPLGNHGKDNLKESVLFKNGVASFTPGTEITVGMLDIGEIGKLENISPSKFKITAKYNWTGRKEPIIEETEIDLTAFMGSGLIPKPDLLYEVSEIKRIIKSLEQKIK